MVVILAAMALARPAAVTTQVRTVLHIDDSGVDSELCRCGVTFHYLGSVTFTDFYDGSGVLKKTIAKGRPGPFKATVTAKRTTLTQQNSSFTEVITYNPDGPVRTQPTTGPTTSSRRPEAALSVWTRAESSSTGDFNVLFEAGPHQNGDFRAFCAAFG